MRRRTHLTLSIVISLVAHGAFIALAPNVTILRAATEPPDVIQRFHVDLVEPTVFPTPVEPEKLRLPEGPPAADDLTPQAPESIEEIQSLMKEVVGIPALEERVASEAISREHDLTQDEMVLAKVDAKIIEIAEDRARKDINVVRRLVRPSPDRVVGKGEYPVLREALDGGMDEVLSIGPFGGRVGSGTGASQEGGVVEPGADAEDLLARREEDTAREKPPALPELSIEELTVRRPVMEEIRKESAYEFIDDLVDIELEAIVPAETEHAFFRLRIAPKEGEHIEPLAKDVTFVVDASRSIPQHKLNRTVSGIQEAIAKLRPEDRFNVVVFRDSATPFREGRVPATISNKTAGIEFLSDIESRGETDVYEAIRPVVLSEVREGVANIVVVATDGRPTAGLQDGRAIINALTADNDLRNTIYVYGAGRTVNRYLIDLLAYRNKGESYVTQDLSDIEVELPGFVSKWSDPILVDCKLDYGIIDETEVYPKEVPDFYSGRAVTIYGRFDPKKDTELAIRLTGKAGSKQKEVVFKADLAKAATGGEEIARAWAFDKIYYLIGEICRVGETPELLDEVRRLSQAYGIKTSYDR